MRIKCRSLPVNERFTAMQANERIRALPRSAGWDRKFAPQPQLCVGPDLFRRVRAGPPELLFPRSNNEAKDFTKPLLDKPKLKF
jgi:hypothetical protein